MGLSSHLRHERSKDTGDDTKINTRRKSPRRNHLGQKVCLRLPSATFAPPPAAFADSRLRTTLSLL
eukprot:12591238-Heterocapsa_arctica.AAC.1